MKNKLEMLISFKNNISNYFKYYFNYSAKNIFFAFLAFSLTNNALIAQNILEKEIEEVKKICQDLCEISAKSDYYGLYQKLDQKLLRLPLKTATQIVENNLVLFKQCNNLFLIPHTYLSIWQLPQNVEEQNVEYLLKAADFANKSNFPLEIAITNRGLAEMFNQAGEDNKALLKYREAQKQFLALGYKRDAIIALYETAMIFYNAFQYQDARKCFTEVSEGNFELLPVRYQINTWNAIGLIHKQKKDNHVALIYYEKALAIAKKNKDLVWVGIISGNKGQIYKILGKLDTAEQLLKTDVAYSIQFGEIANAVTSLNEISNIYIIQKRFKEAEENLQKSIELANKMKEKDFLVKSSIYTSYTEFYSVQNNFQKAYEYQKKKEEILDTLYKYKKSNETNKFQMQDLLKTKNQEIISIRKEQEMQDKSSFFRTIAFVASTIFLLVLLFSFYFTNKKQKIANTILNLQKEEIHQQREEISAQKDDIAAKNKTLHLSNAQLEIKIAERTKDLSNANNELISYNGQLEQFAYIIAHNLRAPVARMLGLLDVFKVSGLLNNDNRFYIDKIEISAKELNEIIGDLNKLLEIKNNLKDFREDVDLESKFVHVCTTLERQIRENNVTFDVDFQVKTIHSVNLYIDSIFYNLVSNAIKYRNVDKQVYIQISSRKDKNMTIITVKDNGMGIDMQKYGDKIFSLYKRFHNHVEGKGMGLHLVKLQIETLGGTIKIDSKLDEGTTFTIAFPTVEHI